MLSNSPSLTNNNWVVRVPARPKATMRLFCFPFSGGSANDFKTWYTYLPEYLEICAIELPGHGRRMKEPFITNYTLLLKQLMENIYATTQELPYIIFGHSLGATIGFEFIHEILSKGGKPPIHFIPSGSVAPQHKADVKPTKPITTKTDSEVVSELRKLGGTPEEVLAHAEIMQIFLPIIRADFALNEDYQYSPDKTKLEIPITSLIGKTDFYSIEFQQNWKQQTNNMSQSVLFPDGHMFIKSLVPAVLKEIKDIVERSK